MGDEGVDIIDGNEGGKKHNWWKFVLLGLLSFALLLGGFSAAVSILGEDRYNDAVAFIDEHFGLLGIFLYVYVVDTLILPLSPDFVFPVVAGMNPFAIIPLIGTASALGGLTSYGAGRLIFHIPLVRKLTGAAYSKWGKYIRRYGFPFVLAAGILPLPFSTICVAAGALKMDIRRILICCSMRYIRTALYFTFFRIGLMAFA